MACQLTNNSNLDISDFEDTIQSLVSFSQDRFGFEKPPSLFLNSDTSNASDPLGKTAYYDPESQEIHIYVDERHPKDIMRSISHELIHHVQNLRGDLSGNHYHGEGYAQKDEHMREMEREAYEKGNLCFRDFEDKLKLDKTTYNEWRTNKMSLKEWKNNELFTLLSGKWGFGKNTITEGAKPFDDGDDKDEKCDYVDCDNEKKLGESNCGDHDEKLEEGEDESVISEFDTDQSRLPQSAEEAAEQGYMYKKPETALDRAIRLGKKISPSQGDEGNYIIDLETYIKDKDPKNLTLSDNQIIKGFVAENGGDIIKEEEEELEFAPKGEPGGELADLAGMESISEDMELDESVEKDLMQAIRALAADRAGTPEEDLKAAIKIMVDREIRRSYPEHQQILKRHVASKKGPQLEEETELEEETLKEAIKRRFARLIK